MIHENIKIFNAVEIEKLNDGVIFRESVKCVEIGKC